MAKLIDYTKPGLQSFNGKGYGKAGLGCSPTGSYARGCEGGGSGAVDTCNSSGSGAGGCGPGSGADSGMDCNTGDTG